MSMGDLPDGAGVPTAVAIRSIVDTLVDPFVLLAPVRGSNGRVVDLAYVEANAAACAFEGFDYERFIGTQLLQIHPGNMEAGTFDGYVRVLEAGEPFALDDVVYDLEGTGETRVYDIRAARADGLVSLTWRDVTDKHRRIQLLAESEERYRLLSENSSDVVMLTRDNSVTWVSPALQHMLGWSPEEWIGQSLSEFGCPEDDPIVVDAMQRMTSGDPAIMRIRLCDKARVPHWVELHAQTYVGADGMPNGVLSSFRTVDDEVAGAAALERLARFDAVTGVLNRHEAMAVIESAGSQRRRPTEQLAVLFCDVDLFKDVNDAHGHAAGDEVLRVLAQRISDTIRREDRVARYGGDEFVILLDSVHDLGEASEIAEKMRAVALDPVRYDGISIETSVSIGATIVVPGEPVERLLRRADKAMYAAKRAGRNRVIAIDSTGDPDDRHADRDPDDDPSGLVRASGPEAA